MRVYILKKCMGFPCTFFVFMINDKLKYIIFVFEVV